MTRRLFTVTAAATLLLGTSSAHADRVVLLPPHGEAPPEQLDDIEEALFSAVGAAGHVALSERAAATDRDVPPPEDGNEMRAVAEMQGAEWTLVPRVVRSGPDGYWLELRAGYAPSTRVESIEAEVRPEREAARLTELLGALLRPEGLGEAAGALAGEDAIARAHREPTGEAGGEEADPDAEARARAEFEEREQRRAEEEKRRAEAEAAARREDRERYGQRGNLLLQAGFGIRPIVRHEDRALGGTANAVELKVGRSFDGVPGLELRGGVDVVFGDTSGFAIYGGGVYLGSPFLFPLHIGAGVELGLHKATSGNDVAQFMVRAAPTFSWRAIGDLYVEASVPELMYLSANDGVLTVGGSLRLGLRF